MKILENTGLTFDDVLLIPQKSSISSRFSGEIDLSTTLVTGITLKYGIISSNMDSITEEVLANKMYELGGLGIIHRFLKVEKHIELLKKVNGPKVLCIGVGKEEFARFQSVSKEVDLSAVLIDIAHGHSDIMLKQIKRIQEVSKTPIIAGNIATYSGALDLISAGIHSIKCGVGNGCFVAGTKILMSNGCYKNIEDIMIGEKVIGSNGQPTKVIGTKNSGIKNIVSYRHSLFYDKCYCTPDHKHLIGDLSSTSTKSIQSGGFAKLLDKFSKTTPRQSKFKWKEIQDFGVATLLFPRRLSLELPDTFNISIEKRCGGNWRTGPINEEDCVLSPNYDIGYIFGTFLGDGCCASCVEFNGSHMGSISWYFGKQEKSIVEKLQLSIREVLNKEVSIVEKENMYLVRLYYKPLADFLFLFGKKNNKSLPENLFVNNKEYLRGIYDGLIDSDGSKEKYGRISFYNTSRKLVEQFGIISYLINGYMPSFSKREPTLGGLIGGSVDNCKPLFAARVGTLGESRQTKDYQVVDRLSYEKIDLLVQTYDIEVDNEDHSFIANNVIVHNSLCTTRIQTGCGVPLLTSLIEARRAIDDYCFDKELEFKPTLICDGGVRNSGDIVKAYAAGADVIMTGSLFSATDETPGKLIRSDGKVVKIYQGMASRSAQENWKGFATSVEGEMTYLPYKGPVAPIFNDLIAGILSGMSYQDALSIEQLRENAEFIRMTVAGYKESLPHGKL